jgi:hypothetical protein
VYNQIVTRDGQVIKSGEGPVPDTVTVEYNFELTLPPVLRWAFVMAADGFVLRSGTGEIPQAVMSLYAGFSDGMAICLLLFLLLGNVLTPWTGNNPHCVTLKVKFFHGSQ